LRCGDHAGEAVVHAATTKARQALRSAVAVLDEVMPYLLIRRHNQSR
jgi:hypothetical protein